MIRHLVTETYGGKIDDDADFALLTSLVNRLLTPAAYDIGHHLVDPDPLTSSPGLPVPSGTTLPDFLAWVNRLPEREPPAFLGLPSNAEKLLLVGLAERLIENLNKVGDLLDEGEQLMAD